MRSINQWFFHAFLSAPGQDLLPFPAPPTQPVALAELAPDFPAASSSRPPRASRADFPADPSPGNRPRPRGGLHKSRGGLHKNAPGPTEPLPGTTEIHTTTPGNHKKVPGNHTKAPGTAQLFNCQELHTSDRKLQKIAGDLSPAQSIFYIHSSTSSSIAAQVSNQGHSRQAPSRRIPSCAMCMVLQPLYSSK